MGAPLRNDPQGFLLTCNTAPSPHKNLEVGNPLVKRANTNEELLRKASSENNIQLDSQEATFRRTILQASKPQVKEPETFDSCEVTYLTKKQVTGTINMDMKPQSDGSPVAQTIHSKETTNDSARMQKERKPLVHFFAFKTQGRASKQEPARTKKAPKSALATLFGSSLDKDKNPKEQAGKALAKPPMETSNGEILSVVCSSNLPKLSNSKEEETAEVFIQRKSSEVGIQDSEENYRSHSRDGQSSPSLDCAKAFSANTLPIEVGTDISSNVVVLSGMKDLEVPKQSNLKIETALWDHSKSSPFPNFQSSLATATENMLQCPASPWMGTNSEINVASRGDVCNQDLPKSPNLASLDGQHLEIKAENVSLLGPSRKDKAQLRHWDHPVPDMLLFSLGVDRSASMGGGDQQSTGSIQNEK
ncbi:uncharacterized protein LOC133365031 [Rhineura floridana]|uniref:uncharacterized protein LOC133365031 n=1 Tax=Rhineura floridana TaxID=261503 RepID=UPI002AC882DE|nr:uncharacterized protein LOC133365031 [Rhineura floridana]